MLLKDINPIVSARQLVKEPRTFTGDVLFSSDVEKIPTLIDPIVPSVGIWALVGSSDTGKSMLLRQLAVSIVKDDNFLGFSLGGAHKKVIYISTEDDSFSTSYLIKKQSSAINGLENIRFYFETENIPEYLESQLTSEPADLIIIDCWSDVFGQNLIDSALIRANLNLYRSIANEHKCSIGFLHHTGKKTEKLEPSKNNILSGQGFEAKMRLVIELRTDLKDSNTKHLCIVKGNYLSNEYKNSSYVLSFDPNTFLFTNTGHRVAFDQLVSSPESNTRPKRVQPNNIPKDTHLKILGDVFKDFPRLKLGELNPKLANHYRQHCNDGFELGKDRVSKFLSFLLEEKLIFKNGKDKSNNAFYSLPADH